MGGIGLQQVFLFLFLLIRIKFNVDVRRQGLRRTTSWRRLLYSLYTVLALITVRIHFANTISLLRIETKSVRFAPSSASWSSPPVSTGPSPRTKSTFIPTLEATPRVLTIGTFAVIHPGRTLTGPESEFSALVIQKGKRRWWCCGRRARTKLHPDFEMQ